MKLCGREVEIVSSIPKHHRPLSMKPRMLAVCFLFIWSQPRLMAHEFIAEANCPKPAAAIDWSDEDEVEELEAAILEYRDCIYAFVEQHQRQLLDHQSAAQKAFEEFEKTMRSIDEEAESLIENENPKAE